MRLHQRLLRSHTEVFCTSKTTLTEIRCRNERCQIIFNPTEGEKKTKIAVCPGCKFENYLIGLPNWHGRTKDKG